MAQLLVQMGKGFWSATRETYRIYYSSDHLFHLYDLYQTMREIRR
jgi:hypothetical protein